jgi:DNA-binding transcriptional MerR regulator
MKISELSRTSGVPIPTLKFYLREGLLPAGTPTAKNQADYSLEHVQRLDLIRTLQDDAGLSLGAIGRVLSAASAEQNPGSAIGAGIAALEQSRKPPPSTSVARDELDAAWAVVDRAARSVGWTLDRKHPAAIDATLALAAIRRAMPEYIVDEQLLARYADIARQIADIEIPEQWAPSDDPHGWMKYAMLGTYLFEPLILALRRVAHQQRSMALIARREQTGARAKPTAKRRRRSS